METLEYIDAYFQQALTQEEKQKFEAKCAEDPSFANEVAFYISARQALKEKLLAQKQQQWIGAGTMEEELPEIPQVKKLYGQRWFMYAAACVLLVFAVYFFEKPESPQQLASNYVHQKYDQISIEMAGVPDSLQQGLTAYNDKHYDEALKIFEALYKSDPEKTDAKKYAGLVYLVTEDYDKALEQFDGLAKKHNLKYNPGLFLKATTLLERNKPGDLEQAKRLLNQVQVEHLEGQETAEEWLSKL